MKRGDVEELSCQVMKQALVSLFTDSIGVVPLCKVGLACSVSARLQERAVRNFMR